jgi:hypothetical protein
MLKPIFEKNEKKIKKFSSSLSFKRVVNMKMVQVESLKARLASLVAIGNGFFLMR